MASPRTGTLVAAALGLVVAGAVGYGIHQKVREVSEGREVRTIVAQTTEQLRGVLKTPAPAVVEKIEENIRVARGWGNPYMADAAEHYLVGAREIARQRADAARHAQSFDAARAALAAHMSRAGARDASWIRTASELKKRVERAHFELSTSLNALADLLRTLPEAQKRLEPYVDASLTLDDALRVKSREQVLAEVRQADIELEKSRGLAPRY